MALKGFQSATVMSPLASFLGAIRKGKASRRKLELSSPSLAQLPSLSRIDRQRKTQQRALNQISVVPSRMGFSHGSGRSHAGFKWNEAADSGGQPRKLQMTAAHLRSHIWSKGPIQGLCYARDGDALVSRFVPGESCFRAEWRLRRLVLFLYYPRDLESGIWLLQASVCWSVNRRVIILAAQVSFILFYFFVVFVFVKSIL